MNPNNVLFVIVCMHRQILGTDVKTSICIIIRFLKPSTFTVRKNGSRLQKNGEDRRNQTRLRTDLPYALVGYDALPFDTNRWCFRRCCWREKCDFILGIPLFSFVSGILRFWLMSCYMYSLLNNGYCLVFINIFSYLENYFFIFYNYLIL